ncbi:DUF6668 family protein [Streptomyces hygroscopicus]|uniref:DUF6668 family protein n=1 Tax=Streptomyces hygroscopicus TaxID=1912 RepID=UPI002AD2A414|nr:DUF6668 family protein [Streptomyces hygroscopicus]
MATHADGWSTGPGIGWVNAHGGAGATTLSGALGGVDIGTRWPDVTRGDPGRFLFVARTHAAGLQAASRALESVRTGRHPAGIELMALVLVADAPGRLPLGLAQRVRVLCSAVRSLRVPWVPAWRMGRPVEKAPKEITEIAALVQTWMSVSGRSS